MSVKGYKFTALTGGGVGAMDAEDGAGLNDGDIAIVMVSGLRYDYELDADSGLAESAPNIIAPDTNAGDKRWILQRTPQTNTVPIGTIVAWSGVYLTGPNNDAVVNVLGNTIADANAYLNPDGWYVCDGSQLNVPGSAKYDGDGRYLPNLTDSRFVLGSTGAGTTGGSNTTSHVHHVGKTLQTNSTTLSLSQIPSHEHDVPHLAYVWGVGTAADHGWKYDNGTPYTSTATTYSGGGGAHAHWLTLDFDSGVPSNTNNMPQYFAALYIEKVT